MCIRDSYDYVRNGLTMKREEVSVSYSNYTGAQYNAIDPKTSRRTVCFRVNRIILRSRVVTIRHGPVSYTHLDVYKRQVYLYMGGLPESPDEEYNRLAAAYADSTFSLVNDVDVYKRQLAYHV